MHYRHKGALGRLACVITTLVVLSSCTHPVEVAGQGDVLSSSGERGCHLEQAPCRFLISGAYHETYTPRARPGYRFSHWTNCLNTVDVQCRWDVDAETVRANWFKSMPPLRAHFVPGEVSTPQPLDLDFSPPPFEVPGEAVDFVSNISYGPHERNVLDVFLPRTGSPTALALYIHEGGFVDGDKSLSYAGPRQDGVRRLLQAGIAYVAINYRFLSAQQDLEGPLQDVQRAVQFVRYHASSFNINKSRLALFGNSAGAGSALWLAVSDDRANPVSTDPVEWESTRVSGVAALETQATYDVVKWETDVFSSFGITLREIAHADTGLGLRMLNTVGANSIDELYNPENTAARARLDMLAMISADDPELYIANIVQPPGVPTNQTTLVHHQLHAKRLHEVAEQRGVSNVSYAPDLGISDPSNETHIDFLLRKLGG